MKMLNPLVATMVLFSMTSTLLAVTGQVQAKPNSAKYGVIDMQAVILNVSEGKDARDKLKGEIEAKEKELMKEKQELDKLNEEWKSQAALLSEAARLKKQQEFQERFLELRNSEMTFQQEIKRKEQSATQSIAVKVAKLVEKMAEEKKLEAVFEANTSGLLYLKDPLDLTKDVITKFESENGKKGKVATKEKK